MPAASEPPPQRPGPPGGARAAPTSVQMEEPGTPPPQQRDRGQRAAQVPARLGRSPDRGGKCPFTHTWSCVYRAFVPRHLCVQPNTFLRFNIYQRTAKLRDPMAAEDNIIIRASLIRHIIFRSLWICLIKYLHRSRLDTQREPRRSPPPQLCSVCECHMSATRGGTH